MNREFSESYQDKETLLLARKHYAANSPKHIQLANFLDEYALIAALKQITTAKGKIEHSPDKHSTTKIDIERIPALRFLNEPKFKNTISQILGKKIVATTAHVAKFKHGDYTLLHDANKQREGTYFELDLTKSWNQSANGYTSIVSGKHELLRINPAFNTLTIWSQSSKTMNFTKYVNNHAGKDERIVIRGKIKY